MKFTHSLLALGILAYPLAGQARIVARMVSIKIDQTDKENAHWMGATHEARIFYDDAQIDPKTGRVKILHEQHTPMLIPKFPDPVVMPVGNGWLDLRANPVLYHFAASPGPSCLPNGKPMFTAYTVLFDEHTQRMTIRNQLTGELELAGHYVVSPQIQSGPQIESVITAAPPPSPYPPAC